MRTDTPTPNALSERALDRISRHHAFLIAAIDDPTLLEGIPNGAYLVLIPEDAADADAEIASGIAAVKEGYDVVFRHFPPRRKD